MIFTGGEQDLYGMVTGIGSWQTKGIVDVAEIIVVQVELVSDIQSITKHNQSYKRVQISVIAVHYGYIHMTCMSMCLIFSWVFLWHYLLISPFFCRLTSTWAVTLPSLATNALKTVAGTRPPEMFVASVVRDWSSKTVSPLGRDLISSIVYSPIPL